MVFKGVFINPQGLDEILRHSEIKWFHYYSQGIRLEEKAHELQGRSKSGQLGTLSH